MFVIAQFSIRFPKSEVLHWAKHYSYPDDDTEVREIGKRSRLAGFYTRGDFLRVCEWKTRGRPRRHYERNSEEDVRRQTAIALTSAHDEETRIRSLTALHGVSWPTASVFLHLAHNEPYPILDFRALWSLHCERSHYTFDFWWDYVQACRALAADCGVSIRDLDRALWEYSRVLQPPRIRSTAGDVSKRAAAVYNQAVVYDEAALEHALEALYQQWGAMGFWAKRLHQKFTPGRRRYVGGIAAVRSVLTNKKEGFDVLKERECLHLSVESLILQQQWKESFCDADRERARRRLQRASN